MNNIDLSFCIPTYNRAEIVYRLVNDILLCKDQAIEVVVLDNGSTDATLSMLGSIKDERLVVYTNGENKGGLYNVVNVIDKAKGKYLVFSTDKDHTNFNEISKFKSFLMQHSDLASGYCTFNSESKIEYEIFPKGFYSIKNVAYKGRHPTGYFFNNKLLKTIFHVERFSNYKTVDMFPFEFIHAELCLMGNGAIWHMPIFTLEPGHMAAKHKSYNASGMSKDAFFSPESRLKMAINYTRHINGLELTTKEKKVLIIDVFSQQLAAATLGYRSILTNRDICSHYYMECKALKAKELLKIGFTFYKQYRLNTIELWGSRTVSQMSFDIRFFISITLKVLRRPIKLIKII